MADIKIDYDGLTQAASSLKNLATTYDGLCTRMKTMTDRSHRLGGQCEQAFTEMMDKYYQQGSIIKSVIDALKVMRRRPVRIFRKSIRSARHRSGIRFNRIFVLLK